jgi:hypothetical protein
MTVGNQERQKSATAPLKSKRNLRFDSGLARQARPFLQTRHVYK